MSPALLPTPTSVTAVNCEDLNAGTTKGRQAESQKASEGLTSFYKLFLPCFLSHPRYLLCLFQGHSASVTQEDTARPVD